MKTHELKTWPAFFDAVMRGSKRFEIRKNDRDFAPGDTLILREYDPEKQEADSRYTGRTVLCEVGFVCFGGVFGIASDHCVMSLLNVRDGGITECA